MLGFVPDVRAILPLGLAQGAPRSRKTPGNRRGVRAPIVRFFGIVRLPHHPRAIDAPLYEHVRLEADALEFPKPDIGLAALIIPFAANQPLVATQPQRLADKR